MAGPLSTFLEFNLPNATTWFYFSFLLAVALFVKFGRLLSLRNWDVVTLFLLVPGLLLVQAAHPAPASVPEHPAVAVAGLVGQAALPAGVLGDAGTFARRVAPLVEARAWLWYGYLWLLAGSGYFFCRCLLDLALVQRPALAPNLNFGGLAWLAGALLVCLGAVAFRQGERQAAADARPAVVATSSAAAPPGTESASLALARQWLRPPPWALSLAAVLCHIAVVAGLAVVGWSVFQDAAAGMAAATFYLMLPYTGLYVGQVAHVAPVALLVWAVAVYRRPLLVGLLLGLTTALVYFPALVLPVWLSFYRGRGAGRFLLGYVITVTAGLCSLGLVLWQYDDLDPILRETLAQTAWQPWRVPVTEGFWTGVHWAYRLPVFLGYLAFVLGTLFWPVPKNLAQTVALTAAVLIGLQFWYADQGGVYVLWYLPLLLLLVFRPNLQDRVAALIRPDTDWLTGSRRGLRRAVRWVIRLPEPAPARRNGEAA